MKFTSLSRRVLASALVASLPALASAQTPPVLGGLGVLGLSAQASVEVPRDLLSITFSTSRDGADANAVQAQLKQALDAALAVAKGAARAGQVEVQTGNFSLYPRYGTPSPSGRQNLTGWQGSAELLVEGKDTATIGALVGRINTMTVGRVGYRLSREASQRVEAEITSEAIARYRARAAEYAKQFGYAGFVIREVNVATAETGPRPMAMARMSPAAASAGGEPLALEPGKESVTVSVSGTVQMQ